MLIKAGVDISRLKRPARRALGMVGGCFSEYGQEIVVTSTYEGNHGDGSLHYADLAFDVRIPAKRYDAIRRAVKRVLDDSKYDFVEEVDSPEPHWHIEYDPDRDKR